MKLAGKLLVLIIVLIVQEIPLLWLFITAVRPEGNFLLDLSNIRLTSFTLASFHSLLFNTPFCRWLINSVVLSICASVIATTLACAVAFHTRIDTSGVLSRLRPLILAAYFLPAMFMVFGAQIAISYLSSILRFISLILLYQIFLFPFSLWVMSGYIERIPRGIISLSLIDNLNFRQRLRFVALPFLLPGLFACFVVCVVLAIQDYLYAMVFLNSPQVQSLTVGVITLEAGDVYSWTLIAAAGTCIALISSIALVSLRGALERVVDRLYGLIG
jgi:multiple sugar transport system permease protein